MRYYSEDTVRDIIKGVAHTALEQTDNFSDAMLTGRPHIEIKEPHGRLTDADAEIEAYELMKTCLKECGQKKTFAFKQVCHAIKVLRDAPTVLEATE